MFLQASVTTVPYSTELYYSTVLYCTCLTLPAGKLPGCGLRRAGCGLRVAG